MVESGRGGRSCRAGPGLATVAWGAGRGHDSLGCRRRRAMLCRNIAAGWYLSVQRGRAKTNILGHWVGVIDDWSCWSDLEKDLGESMTKVGLWGIRFIAAALAPFFFWHRPAGTSRGPGRLTVLINGRIWAVFPQASTRSHTDTSRIPVCVRKACYRGHNVTPWHTLSVISRCVELRLQCRSFQLTVSERALPQPALPQTSLRSILNPGRARRHLPIAGSSDDTGLAKMSCVTLGLSRVERSLNIILVIRPWKNYRTVPPQLHPP